MTSALKWDRTDQTWFSWRVYAWSHCNHWMGGCHRGGHIRWYHMTIHLPLDLRMQEHEGGDCELVARALLLYYTMYMSVMTFFLSHSLPLPLFSPSPPPRPPSLPTSPYNRYPEDPIGFSHFTIYTIYTQVSQPHKYAYQRKAFQWLLVLHHLC